MAGRKRLEDLDITREELKEIGEALKKEEFRKLLNDYVDEVTDPENKKKFQEEVTQFEKERGYDVTFVNPGPGYVIKTSVDDEKKAFINVCVSDKIKRPTSISSTRDGTYGKNWSVPYSQAPPRDDLDNAGNRCVVYDVVFNPEAIKLADWNVQFRNMLNDTALDAVEKNFNVKLDRKNLKFPKMKYKGMAFSTIIRKKTSSPAPEEDEELKDLLSKMNYPYEEPPKPCVTRTLDRRTNDESTADKTPYTIPKYLIKHRNVVDYQDFTNDKNAKLNSTIPKEIVVEIDLPLLSSTSDATLDVTEKTLSLISEKPAKYKLFIALPYCVDENSGKAKFDKTKRKLCITLPLKNYCYAPLADFGREDSGVESDAGPRTPESSSGEDDSIDSATSKLSCNALGKLTISIKENSNEENGNEVSNSKTSVSVLDNEVFRTNKSESKFLDDDKHYSFPSYTCNVVDDLIIFTLHVKNVDPDSVKHQLLNESCGIHLKFTSIGSGFFPIHHAFCTKISTSSICEDSVNIETWDNNIIVQIQMPFCDLNLLNYYAGVNEDSLVKHDLPEPSVIAKKMEELQVSYNPISMGTSELDIQVTKCTRDETVVEISTLGKQGIKPSEVNTSEKETESSEDNAVSENEDSKSTKRPMLAKCRTLSESSGDEMSFSPSKKGILKRVCRSLSESSADDYTWSSSLDMMMQSGSDSCIPEEDGRGVKKTVRFNEVVHQQTYRSNSSIFGQRKKNQRKTRNKKRAQDRRASESENSEGEVDKDADRESKTEKNQDDEEGNGNDDELQDANDVADEVFEIQLKLQDEKPSTPKKNSFLQGFGRGKKKSFKKSIPPPPAHINMTNSSKLDLKNELIFDLDM